MTTPNAWSRYPAGPVLSHLGAAVGAGLCLFLLAGPVWAQPSATADRGRCPQYFFNFTDGNDFFAGLTDRHFTQGIRLSLVERGFDTSAPEYEERLARHCTPGNIVGRAGTGTLRFFTGLVRTLGRSTLGHFGFNTDTVGIVLGQNIYTPEDLSQSALIPNDRPYAGWLYLGFEFFHEQKDRQFAGFQADSLDTVEVDLGLIGPASGAEKSQREWHDFIGDEDPKGWDNQLHNEFALLIAYDRKYRILLAKSEGFRPGVDVIPSAGGTLGNVFTYVAAGGVVRVGYNLSADYGPPRIRPGTQGSDFFDTAENPPGRFMAYLYTGVEGRLVAQDIFLDGNTFKTSHAVNKRYFVGDWQFGGALAYDRFRFAYTMVYRSQEYKNQFEPDIFGSVTLSIRF